MGSTVRRMLVDISVEEHSLLSCFSVFCNSTVLAGCEQRMRLHRGVRKRLDGRPGGTGHRSVAWKQSGPLVAFFTTRVFSGFNGWLSPTSAIDHLFFSSTRSSFHFSSPRSNCYSAEGLWKLQWTLILIFFSCTHWLKDNDCRAWAVTLAWSTHQAAWG